MKTKQDVAVKKIQSKFNKNSIYARSVLRPFRDFSDIELIISKVGKIIAEEPKPFVKWVGGKRQLLKQFRELGLYPPDGFDPYKSTYFEPFVGGGAVFLDLLPLKAVLSDVNYELITTYNVIKNDVEKLIKSLKKHKNTKEYFLKCALKT